ncbi:restriction endonuclease [Streptomyces sp. NPDC046215]|uniref:Restriction endonuclease n=1 Tax=Streptomyces stramineus TaxID=173861 RepID=A0ABN0ZVV0_9ACTN
MRQLALGFGLVAVVLFGAGVTLRSAARSAGDRPFTVLVTGLAALAITAAGMRWWRGRGARYPAGAWMPDAAAEVDEVGEAPAVAVTGVAYEEMDAQEFEQAVAELCRRDGCLDVEVVGGAGDLGADVLATAPGGQRLVIQCKRYGASHKVGSQDLQRFGGTCFAVHDAHIAAVVTTSDFTEPAADYAARCGIRCFDGGELTAWATGVGPAPWEG